MSVLRTLLTALAALLASLTVLAAAAPVDRAALDLAIASGRPVVVQFHADWCPTCRAQAAVLPAVLSDPKLKSVKFVVADFDTELDLKKALKVSSQSTFVVFKGGKEVARSTGQTQRAGIAAVFTQAL
jgi:thioredoxin 1